MSSRFLLSLISTSLALPCMAAELNLDQALEKCKEQERRIQQLESYIRSIDGKIPPRPLPNTPVKELTPTPTPVEPLSTLTKASATTGQTHTVKAGDNWDNIARKYRCSPADLSHANNLTVSSIIYPGQIIKIPSGQNPPTATPTPSPAATDPSQTPPTKSVKTYTIKEGDTYSSISKRLKIPVNTLIAANPKIKPTALRSGLVIQLGQSVTTPSPQAPPTKPVQETPPTKPTPEPQHTKPVAEAPITPPTPASEPPPTDASAPAIEAEPSPQPAPPTTAATPQPASKSQLITLDETMTFAQLAARYTTTVDALNLLNGQQLSPNTILAKGTSIHIPAPAH